MEQHPIMSRDEAVARRRVVGGRGAAGGDAEPQLGSIEDLRAVRSEWNRLAALEASPFLTYDWLASWWSALGQGDPLCLLLRAPDGTLRAGAFCRRSPSGRLTAPTDPHYSEEWDVLAGDDAARRRVWDSIARLGVRRMSLMPLHERRADRACEALQARGYRVMRGTARVRPYLPLPGSWDDLLASLSHKLRWQWRRSRRGLDRDGGLLLRTTTSEAELDRDLEIFLALEASGWKGREGTAILNDPRAERLYREFAARAARQGWLRLSILESAGVPVAAAYGCVFAGKAYRLKSGFDERRAGDSPGLVLVGEELRRSIDEELHEYDFLGTAQPHKLRWGAVTRRLVTVDAYRGATTLPAYAVRAKIRPALGRLRRRVKAAVENKPRDAG
jgi:CelD/BcsL family acetyltransferase involved in cellulose biosynthesis